MRAWVIKGETRHSMGDHREPRSTSPPALLGLVYPASEFGEHIQLETWRVVRPETKGRNRRVRRPPPGVRFWPGTASQDIPGFRRVCVPYRTLVARPLTGGCRPQTHIDIAIPGRQDAAKGHKQRGQCSGCRDATDFAALGDVHRSAGVRYFWITCRSGVLSSNRIITCYTQNLNLFRGKRNGKGKSYFS
jgi:hypothetical protein